MALLLIIALVGFAIVLWIHAYRKKTYNEHWKYIMEIPGPKTFPIIGNGILYMIDAENVFNRDRERALQFYPIYRLWSFNLYFICIISPEDIELVLANTKHITKSDLYLFLKPWLGTGLLTSYGSKWQTRRKVLTPAFHFSILQEYIEIFNRETQNLVDVLKKNCQKPYIDVVKPITEFTLFSIGETSLGVKLSEEPNCQSYKQAVYDYGHFLTWRIVRPWLHFQPIYNLTAVSKSDKATVKILHDFSTNVIKERKKTFIVGEDLSYSAKKRLALLDLMLTAKYGGADIDDEGIREEVDTFMFEGHDTTSMALCYSLMALANEQFYQKEIVQEIYDILGDSDKPPSFNDLAEMKVMERCIKESLRLYPSVPFIGRTAGEEIKTHSGYTIPKGANINIFIFDMHRNPQVWDNPEKFDPDRFLPENAAKRHPFAYLPFSAGSRNCIGQRFAILEMKAALCGILRNFKLEPVDRPQDMKFKTDMVLRPVGEIRVKFVPRS